jgi:tetratricopeptide (TPR) repeat protein
MIRIRNHVPAYAVASALALGLCAPAQAQSTVEDGEKLDSLFAELAEPGREDWNRVESEITGIWSRSGSASMDLLLRRGGEAMEAEEYGVAIEHLTALTDHAPDFAEGWNARATAFYLTGEYALAIADIERVLALEPRHFGAISGLAFMLEDMGETALALKALRMVHEINPNRPTVSEAISRLERATGADSL